MRLNNPLSRLGLLVLAVGCLFGGPLQAQQTSYLDSLRAEEKPESLSFLVTDSSDQELDTLAHPLAGGLNFPRFQPFHLNEDTLQDLIVFDNQDSRLLPFVQKSQPDSGSRWRYAPRYRDAFPEELLDIYVLTNDYDRDGDYDLFTNHGTGQLRLIENISSGGELQFRVEQDIIRTQYSLNGPDSTNLYSGPSSIPGLVDVDGDGDLDILNYNITGTRLEWHKNEALEHHGRVDTMDMRLVSDCWGHFYEQYDPSSETFSLKLQSVSCNETPKTAHAGGQVLPINFNNDSLIDVIVSDVGVNLMAAAINGGTRDIADMVQKQPNFPGSTDQVDITSFPVGFYVDVDGDGIRDLVASPNEFGVSQDYRNAHFYKNMGQDEAPSFKKVQEDFLVGEMVEVGTGAVPVFFDYNGDQKPDLVVANNWRRSPNGTKAAGLVLYENVGSQQDPRFKLVDDDFVDLYSQASTLKDFDYLRPTFGDLDNDGDQDLLIGTGKGQLWQFENKPVNGKANFKYVTDDYLKLSQRSYENVSPLLYDYDGDGDQDLLIGNQKGNIVYFKNQSTTQANFVFEKGKLGGVEVTEQSYEQSAYLDGYATPRVFDINFDGQEELLISNTLGSVIVYDSLTNNLNAAFDSVGHLMPNIAFNYGIATPYPHKFGGKDSVLFLYGTQTGGLMGVHVSKQDTAVEDDDQDTTDPSVRRPRKAFKHQLKVYPNPASQRVRIDAPAPTQLRIIDMRGRTVAQRRIDDPTQPLSMDVQDWAPGIYTLHFYWSGHSAYKRLMISGH